MNKLLAMLCAIPKTLYVNFKCLDFRDACKLPIIVSHRARVKGIKRGSIVFDGCSLKTGMVRLGMSDGAYEKGMCLKSYLAFAPDSQIFIRGAVHIANNFAINMCRGGKLILGDNFSSNYNLTISCSEHIEFGNNALLGWSCTFIDGDGHSIYNKSKVLLNADRPIIIGNHVWIAGEVTCLKGSLIADGCVVGFGSIIAKKYAEPNSMLIGVPARSVKTEIEWEH